MNVCFLGGTRYRQPLDPTLQKKFNKLAELGQIVVIGFSMDAKPRRFEQYALFYLLPCFSAPVLRYLLFFVLGPIVTIWCIFRHDVRILVAQSPYEGCAAIWAKIVAGMMGKRVVVVVESHGDFERSLFFQRRIVLSGIYRFLMRRVASFSLRHADALRSVSRSASEQLQKWVGEKTIVAFPTWTDMEVFWETGKKKKADDTKEVILYAGVITPLKGIHFLLEAFRQIARRRPAVELWVIGRAEDGKYAQELRGRSRELGLDGRVCFLEPLSQDQLAERMAMAKALVLPSLSEGLPRVVLEAMACGTPIVGSNVGGIPEVVADKENGFLVDPGDVVSLSDRILWILEHPKEADEMGKRGRDIAGKFFTQEAYVQNYARLFELARQVVENHAR